MGALIDIAGAMISRAEQRATIVAQNMSNLTTPGYRAVSSFGRLLRADDPDPSPTADELRIGTATGKLISTGNPLDLAIQGNGYFSVRSGETLLLTRSGQFQRDASGRLVTPTGAVLQSDQGDCVVGEGTMKVDTDGTVHIDGDVATRLTILDVASPSTLTPMGANQYQADQASLHPVESPSIRQGSLESSNVSQAGEMLSMMAVLRSAESGQKIMQLYDDLMGQAITTFGQAAS